MNRQHTTALSFHTPLALWGILPIVAVLVLIVPCKPAWSSEEAGFWRAQYVIPKELRKTAIRFAEERIPLEREDVASRVVEQMNYLLMDRRASMMEWFDRMAQYAEPVKRVLAEEKVPEDLLYVSVLLGEFHPGHKTSTGGIGWWGLGSTESKNQSNNLWVSTNEWDDRRDPEISTRIACSIFQRLHQKKETGTWLLTICAFLDGADKIEAALKKASEFTFWDVVLPPRSEAVIPRLIALKIIDAHRDLYGVDVPRLPPVQCDTLGRVKLDKELPLYVAAKWCNVSPRFMWELNPGVDPGNGVLPKPDKRSPAGFPLRVPKGSGTKVKDMLTREGYLKP